MAEARKVCPRCGSAYADDVLFCPEDGAPLTTGRVTQIDEDPYVGLVVAGQFELQHLIGVGSMGRVYRAHQKGMDRHVAVKVLHRELMMNPTLVARFHRESRVASRLSHPNVVQVLTTGELDRGGPAEGEAYLVMEYLDGVSLRSALSAAGGAFPLPRALHVVLQVCDAVGEAHAQGIVHRDLKPENVMLVRRGDDTDFVKILDFGVARIEWADSTVATQAGSIFGTARYISPEGAQGERVAPPGDVYSIATLLFQCLAGRTPFEGDNPVAVLLKQTHEPPPDIRSIPRSSYVPAPIARVLTENLAKSPGDRCRDARELGHALVQAARASGIGPDELVLRSTLLGGTGRSSPPIGPRPAAPAPGGGVEPTLSDAPAGQLIPPASLSPGPPPASSARIPAAPGSRRSAGRRRALLAGCFLLGAGASVLIALRLGIFRAGGAARPGEMEGAGPANPELFGGPEETPVLLERAEPPSSWAGDAAPRPGPPAEEPAAARDEKIRRPKPKPAARASAPKAKPAAAPPREEAAPREAAAPDDPPSRSAPDAAPPVPLDPPRPPPGGQWL